MAKFLLLFIGGDIPEDKKVQSVTDRLTWMNDLKEEGKFIDGSPLMPSGKVIADETLVTDFTHDDNSINGYAIIEADSIDNVTSLAQTAPQVMPEYGCAKAEVRPLNPLVNN